MKVKGLYVETIKLHNWDDLKHEKGWQRTEYQIYLWMDSERAEEKEKTKTNLEIGYSSDNERTMIRGWGLGR